MRSATRANRASKIPESVAARARRFGVVGKTFSRQRRGRSVKIGPRMYVAHMKVEPSVCRIAVTGRQEDSQRHLGQRNSHWPDMLPLAFDALQGLDCGQDVFGIVVFQSARDLAGL